MLFNVCILFIVNIVFCQDVLSERYTTFDEYMEDKKIKEQRDQMYTV